MKLDLEAEYNNRARVPDHPAVIADWKKAAEAFRASHPHAELDLVFGSSYRQKIDIFWPASSRNAPLVLFIHGGYWQALDHLHFSHFAKAANRNGMAFALCGYDLCPQVAFPDILDQLRAAALFLWRRLNRRIVVTGHSAGGHLVACLLATNWSKIAPDMLEDFVPAGISISGVFDLAPLLATSINRALRLGEQEARRYSPIYWPLSGRPTLDAWVGELESTEFLRQSRAVAQAWEKRGAETAYREISGANHFTVLDPLSDPGSEISQRLAALGHALR